MTNLTITDKLTLIFVPFVMFGGFVCAMYAL